MRTVVLSLASACWLVASLSLVHCGGDSSSGASGSASSGTSSGTGNTGSTGSGTGSTGSGTGSTGSGTGSTGSGTGSTGSGTGSTGSGTGSAGSGTSTGGTGSSGTTTGTTGSSGTGTGTTGTTGTAGSTGSSGSGSKDAGAGDASKGPVDSGGASGGDGSVSPANFQPCPMDGGACKILPLGDSITYGIDSSNGGGYRVELFTNAVNNNKNITFVGSQTSGPATVDNKPFPTANEGHSGWTVEQIQGITPMDLMPNPNIILLMIGTNNMYSAGGSTPAGAATDLPKLVDTLLMDAPNALLVVSTITPLDLYQNGMYETDVTTYNATIQPMVASRAAAGKHILFVDQFTGFDSATMITMSDKIHPNDTGYKHMGDVWYAAISPYLP